MRQLVPGGTRDTAVAGDNAGPIEAAPLALVAEATAEVIAALVPAQRRAPTRPKQRAEDRQMSLELVWGGAQGS